MPILNALLLFYLSGFIFTVLLLVYLNRRHVRSLTPQQRAKLQLSKLYDDPTLSDRELIVAGVIWFFTLLVLSTDFAIRIVESLNDR